MTRRFNTLGIQSTEQSRRTYREMLFTAPGEAEFISGVILQDESMRQKNSGGMPLAELLSTQGMLPGIKVDTGAKPLAGSPGETVTEGLDGLRDRLQAYHGMGARFAKWRAVIHLTDVLPSSACVAANAHALARYAALCQEQGKECARQASVEEVATATLRCLRRHVPAAVPGIVFLSGGQNASLATAHLNAINRLPSPKPWKVSFSYGRALQDPALEAWHGRDEHLAAGQKALYHRARSNGAASVGKYTDEMDDGIAKR